MTKEGKAISGGAGLELLDRKLTILRREHERLRLLKGRTGQELERSCRDAETWLLRAALLGGQRGLRLAAGGPPAIVTVAWRDTMGIRYPAEGCPWRSWSRPTAPACGGPWPEPTTARRRDRDLADPAGRGRLARGAGRRPRRHRTRRRPGRPPPGRQCGRRRRAHRAAGGRARCRGAWRAARRRRGGHAAPHRGARAPGRRGRGDLPARGVAGAAHPRRGPDLGGRPDRDRQVPARRAGDPYVGSETAHVLELTERPVLVVPHT